VDVGRSSPAMLFALRHTHAAAPADALPNSYALCGCDDAASAQTSRATLDEEAQRAEGWRTVARTLVAGPEAPALALRRRWGC